MGGLVSHLSEQSRAEEAGRKSKVFRGLNGGKTKDAHLCYGHADKPMRTEDMMMNEGLERADDDEKRC